MPPTWPGTDRAPTSVWQELSCPACNSSAWGTCLGEGWGVCVHVHRSPSALPTCRAGVNAAASESLTAPATRWAEAGPWGGGGHRWTHEHSHQPLMDMHGPCCLAQALLTRPAMVWTPVWNRASAGPWPLRGQSPSAGLRPLPQADGHRGAETSVWAVRDRHSPSPCWGGKGRVSPHPLLRGAEPQTCSHPLRSHWLWSLGLKGDALTPQPSSPVVAQAASSVHCSLQYRRGPGAEGGGVGTEHCHVCTLFP